MVYSTEYRNKVLEERQMMRGQKRKTLEDLLHPDARKNANGIAKVRRVAREALDAFDAGK